MNNQIRIQLSIYCLNFLNNKIINNHINLKKLILNDKYLIISIFFLLHLIVIIYMFFYQS